MFDLQIPDKPAPEPEKKPVVVEEVKETATESSSDNTTISLEEADGEDIPEVKVEDDDESENDDTFLESDDENDDMSNLVNVTKDNKEDT